MNSFAGVFGMSEMEDAAEIIVAKQTGILIDHGFLVPVYLSDFATDSQKTGFLELIYGGFMTKQEYNTEFNTYTYNGGFIPAPLFFDRISKVIGGTKPDRLRALELRSATASMPPDNPAKM